MQKLVTTWTGKHKANLKNWFFQDIEKSMS